MGEYSRSGRCRDLTKCVSDRVFQLHLRQVLKASTVLGHQDWLDGLITAASGGSIGNTNLEAIDFPVRK